MVANRKFSLNTLIRANLQSTTNVIGKGTLTNNCLIHSNNKIQLVQGYKNKCHHKKDVDGLASNNM